LRATSFFGSLTEEGADGIDRGGLLGFAGDFSRSIPLLGAVIAELGVISPGDHGFPGILRPVALIGSVHFHFEAAVHPVGAAQYTAMALCTSKSPTQA